MNDVLAACTVHVDVYAVSAQLTRVACAARRCAHIYGGGGRGPGFGESDRHLQN